MINLLLGNFGIEWLCFAFWAHVLIIFLLIRCALVTLNESLCSSPQQISKHRSMLSLHDASIRKMVKFAKEHDISDLTGIVRGERIYV